MAKATGAKGSRSRITAAKPAARKAAAMAELPPPLPPGPPIPRGMAPDAGVAISEDAFPELDAVAAIQRGLPVAPQNALRGNRLDHDIAPAHLRVKLAAVGIDATGIHIGSPRVDEPGRVV